ncbi:putative conserved eukaryotic alpha beta hydrolase [Cryptosporidium canis]|uniref:Conserved eukaryotic alpha beta hydrolase n=1 Tax=Cryptosporidium canis TaxID=195482 RepID=A0ABQ8P2M2_9CRYT|nr:putative conserved eukaryotic alpha beta hydrolase [Cryptosporidium canis]KAJ1612250.1 putative conserved eukaryotic alpha beta hydrolase [Cryptosporidium canis]
MVIQKFVDVAMFPGTYSSYDITSYPETILIPGPVDAEKKIPCFLFAPRSNSKIFVIYAHANGVDIGEIHGRLRYVSERLKVNMLLFDYPGYGKYEGRSDESSVDQCMTVLLNFVTQELNWPIENIILWGCSIGTGPSTRLAKILNQQKKKLGGLILQCPYKSIKHAAESLAGKIGRFLISQRWNIQSEIMDCYCPVLWIHGKKDSLFSWHGSFEMFNSYHTHLRSCHFPKDASHHYFDIEMDIILPIQQFINKFVLPNTLPIFESKCTKDGKKTKFNINKVYNNKLNAYRPTVLDVYLTRNTNVKISKENSNVTGDKKSSTGNNISQDSDVNNIRVIGPKDIKSILQFWGNNKKDANSMMISQKNMVYLDGDFTPKYIWLNGEAGEYIQHSKENKSRVGSSSSIYLSSSGEDEFEENSDYDGSLDDETNSSQSDDNSSEELKCYNRLVNSNLISSSQVFHKNIKQCISYNNTTTNANSVYDNNLEKFRRCNLRKRNVVLNNPSIFRMECRNRMERLNTRSFVKSEEILLNFWPVTNLYCYLYDQYYQFFQLILNKLKNGDFSFTKNGNDTFLSIIMWVRRLYYIYTPTLFMNSIYSYNSSIDQWNLEGVTLGNIYIQLTSIGGISGRLSVKLLDKYPISSCFPPPFYIVLPLYVPPKPFFQPIAEWIVRTAYRLYVYNLVKSNKSSKYRELYVSQKYANIDSFNDPMNQLETKCLLEELSFSSLQHFLLSNTRPKIEKLALVTGFGNWIPFGWSEFFVKLFEANSKHYLQRLLFINQDEIRLSGNDFVNLLVPFYLPSYANMSIIYKIIKAKIKTRDEWMDCIKTKSSMEGHDDEINNLIHPNICNSIFSNLMAAINTSIKITDGLTQYNAVDNYNESSSSTEGSFLLQNNQLNWQEILKDFDSFSNFMSKINFLAPKLSLPGISQSFRGKQNTGSQELHCDKAELQTSFVPGNTFLNNSIVESPESDKSIKCIDSNESSSEVMDVDSNRMDSFHDEVESPEQTIIRSFQGKIILIDDSDVNKCEQNEEAVETRSRSSELPLTWESVFLSSQDPLLIINQLQYHDRLCMGMSPSNYIILHRSLYERYSFLRLNNESEHLFRLLWHFSHCCIYHGNLLSSSLNKRDAGSFVIHPLHCILLISGILRRSLESPESSDLSQLKWEGCDSDQQYYGFNSSCINSTQNRKLNIIERILSISLELIENGVCNQIVNYQFDRNSNYGSFILGGNIQGILKARGMEPMDSILNQKEPNAKPGFNNLATLNSSTEEGYERNINVNIKADSSITDSHSNSSSLSSSRVSSLESVIQNVYDGKINKNELSSLEAKQNHRVFVYSSTKSLHKHAFFKDEGFLKMNRNNKLAKETRIVNISNHVDQFSKISPIVLNQDLNQPHNQNVIRSIDLEPGNALFEKSSESCRGDRQQNKFKMFTSSPLRIFKK